MTTQPTVLLLITTFDLSGAERVFAYLARGLAAHGYRVIAACLQERSGAVARELAGSGVRVASLGVRHRLSPFPWLKLVRMLRRERVDAVYTFMFHPHLVGRSASRVAGVPIVLSSQQVMAWEGASRNTLNRLTARWCDRVVAVSDAVGESLVRDVGIPSEKVTTIFNCVDLDHFSLDDTARDRDPAGPVIGSAARLAPEKDHRTLIDALGVVRERHPATVLKLAGDGPEREALVEYARRRGLAEGVEFLGRVEDIRRFYAGLDVYVQSSHAEGLPCSVLEAMACSLPVVATEVGGSPEAVAEGESGFLVAVGDVDALAARLLTLIGDPNSARAMGAHGRQRAAKLFGVGQMVADTDRLLRAVARERNLGWASDG